MWALDCAKNGVYHIVKNDIIIMEYTDINKF